MVNQKRRSVVNKVVLLLFASLFAVLTGSAVAQVANDVPREHYAYGAIQDLVQKDLVKGYPPDGNFWGKRTATRYEMATLIQRVLARVEELLAKKADRDHTHPATAAPSRGVSPEDLETVKRLVNEFKMELTVLGTDLAKVKEMVGELRGQIDGIKSAVESANEAAAQAKVELGDFKAEFQDIKESLTIFRSEFDYLSKDVKARKLSGYVQARFEAFDRFGTAQFPAAGGTGTTGVNPAGGGLAVGGPGYGFLVRRARFKFGGQLTTRTDWAAQLDLPSIGSVAVKDAFINVSDLPLPSNFQMTFGLFAPPFGVELPASSSIRESPERAAGFSDSTAPLAIFKTPSTGGPNSNNPVTGASGAAGGVASAGAVLPLFNGQDRDTGVLLTYSAPNYFNPVSKVMLGVFNGEGRGGSGVRNNNRALDAVFRAQTSLFDAHLDIGISGYYGTLSVRSGPPTGSGTSAVAAPYTQGYRMLAGADVRYLAPWGTTFRAEYAGGVFEASPDRSQYLKGNHAQAWLVSVKHPISRRFEFACKYDEFMPITQKGKTFAGLGRAQYTRKTLQGGFLYYLDEATRFRFWYAKGLTPYDPSASSGAGRNRLGLATAEVQVTY